MQSSFPGRGADLRTDDATKLLVRIASRLSILWQSHKCETLGAWSKFKTGKNFLATKELRNSGEGLIVDKFSSLEVEKKYRHCERSEFTPEAIQKNVKLVGTPTSQNTFTPCHTVLDTTSINANKTDRFRITFGIIINRNNFPFSTFNFQFFAGARGIACPTRHAELVSASYQLVVIRPVGQILNNLKITDKCPYFLRFQNDTLNTSLNKPFNSTWRVNPC